jgi:hypothetical protein
MSPSAFISIDDEELLTEDELLALAPFRFRALVVDRCPEKQNPKLAKDHD